MKSPQIGLKGRAKVEVINNGKVIASSEGFKSNLILDQGLDRMSEIPIADLFKVCAKGWGSFPTTEVVDVANTYTQNSGSTTVTRAAGTRDFTALDVGKLIRYSNGVEAKITAFTDATHVEASPAPGSTITTLNITLYSVHQKALQFELGRTQDYSNVSGENGTTTVGAVRTLKRTFIFGTENIHEEYVDIANGFDQSAFTVTRQDGARNFTSDDVGKLITFLEGGQTATIVALIDTESVTVDVSQTVAIQAIKLTADSGKMEDVADTNLYTRAGTTVERTAGTRDFTAADVGKIIHFDTSDVESKIVTFTDATHVEVEDSGVLVAQTIRLYGFQDYIEFGFSDAMDRTSNLNMRVVLGVAVRANIETPLRSSDQLKVTYELDVTVSPSVSTAGNLGAVIYDPGSDMSGNKNGDYAIESYATSQVGTNGATDSSFADLEPFVEGFAALSQNDDAIAPFSFIQRDESVSYVAMISAGYTLGNFYEDFVATFALNDAIGTTWRTLMIFNPTTENSIFAFVFDTNQRKDGTHTLKITFRKAWGRDLS